MIKRVTMLMVVLAICVPAWAQRQLDRSEVPQIFETLTQKNQKTWISAGTITATLEEYHAPPMTDETKTLTAIDAEVQTYRDNPAKAERTEGFIQKRLQAIPFNTRYKLSNEYTMKTRSTVKYDSNRFYWQIEVDSRVDSVKPDPELQDNFFTEDFKLFCNTNRIFAWDGAKYTAYIRPMNNANRKRSVIGERSTDSGIIPWGHGKFSIENLIEAESSATEIQTDSGTEIQLALSIVVPEKVIF